MIKLAIYGIIALALMAAIGGVIIAHDRGVRTKALAPWQPLIKKCEGTTGGVFKSADAVACEQQWSQAVAFNVILQEDVKTNAAQTAECNAKVKDFQQASAGMKARRADAEAANRSKIEAAQQRATSLEQALAEAKSGKREVSCAKSVAKVGAVLLPIASDRVRDFAPATGTPGPGGPAPAPVRPGPDAVRVGK